MSVKSIAFALVMLAAAPAFAADILNVDTGRYDLLRAHNERAFVVFGHDVTFKRYQVVQMLNQFFTVAQDVPGGVRYMLSDRRGEKTLLIE